ncbi:MAG: ArnT family glycosyltransferase, partial [Thermoplasmatota archaeon]
MKRDRILSFTKAYWPLLVLFSAVLAVRMAAAVLLPLEPDEEIYASIARDVSDGESIFDSSTGVYRAPIFIYALALWFKVFGVSFVSARIFAAAFSSLTVLAVFLVGRELFDRRIGLIGAAAAGFLPFSIRYNYVVMSEPLQWVFVSFGLLFLVMGVKRERWYFHALSGLFVLLSIGVRRSSFVFPLIMVFFHIWYYRSAIGKLFKYCGS